MKNKFTLRDFLAVPFWSLAQLFEFLAIVIGGEWTSEIYIDQLKKIAKIIK